MKKTLAFLLLASCSKPPNDAVHTDPPVVIQPQDPWILECNLDDYVACEDTLPYNGISISDEPDLPFDLDENYPTRGPIGAFCSAATYREVLDNVAGKRTYDLNGSSYVVTFREIFRGVSVDDDELNLNSYSSRLDHIAGDEFVSISFNLFTIHYAANFLEPSTVYLWGDFSYVQHTAYVPCTDYGPCEEATTSICVGDKAAYYATFADDAATLADGVLIASMKSDSMVTLGIQGRSAQMHYDGEKVFADNVEIPFAADRELRHTYETPDQLKITPFMTDCDCVHVTVDGDLWYTY